MIRLAREAGPRTGWTKPAAGTLIGTALAVAPELCTHEQHGHRPGLSRNPRAGGAHLRRLSRQLLARPRRRRRLSHGLRPGADPKRLPRRPHPRGARRRRPAASGRRRHPRDHPRLRCQCRRLPRPDVHHGHAAPAWQPRAEGPLFAGDRRGRVAAPGLRRHRADERLRHADAEDQGRAPGRPLDRQWPEDLDQPGAPLRPHAAAGAHDPDRAVQESAATASPSFWSTSARPGAKGSRSARSTP
jgi:hypothetical protein